METDSSYNDEEELPPRMLHKGNSAALFDISNDQAVQQVALMVVAGVDKRYSLHPRYRTYLGPENDEKKARRLIEEEVSLEDNMQTEKELQGGPGLYGGLTKKGDNFIFYESMSPQEGQMKVFMPANEARAIVKGIQKKIVFYPALERENY